MKLLASNIQPIQFFFKRVLGAILGVVNVAAIYGVVKLAEAELLKPYLYRFDVWFWSPFHVNLLGAFKGLIAGAVYLAGLPLSLLSYLMNLLFQADVVHLNVLTDLIRGVVNRLVPVPGWAQVAVFRPADLVPFDHQILSFVHSSDLVLAIILSVGVTAAVTWLTALITAKDIPLVIAQALNRRRADRTYQRIKELAQTLAKVDIYDLPPSPQTDALKEMARFLELERTL